MSTYPNRNDVTYSWVRRSLDGANDVPKEELKLYLCERNTKHIVGYRYRADNRDKFVCTMAYEKFKQSNHHLEFRPVTERRGSLAVDMWRGKEAGWQYVGTGMYSAYYRFPGVAKPYWRNDPKELVMDEKYLVNAPSLSAFTSSGVKGEYSAVWPGIYLGQPYRNNRNELNWAILRHPGLFYRSTGELAAKAEWANVMSLSVDWWMPLPKLGRD
ncbi:MAG: hypothetical protein AAGD25_06655 [Cyanobacteria bacterium P01_F01_bin.150]